MKLRVISPYRCRREAYAVGEVIDVSAEHGAFLLRDAPSCFTTDLDEPKTEAPEVQTTDLDAPPRTTDMKPRRGSK